MPFSKKFLYVLRSAFIFMQARHILSLFVRMLPKHNSCNIIC